MTKTSSRRYSLILPEDLFAKIQEEADKRNTTLVEIIRKFLKIGLLAAEIQKRPESTLIIREGDSERELVIL